jgi:hypothetical protein
MNMKYLICLVVILSACTPNIQPSIKVQELPIEENLTGPGIAFGKLIQINSVTDNRTTLQEISDDVVQFTQPTNIDLEKIIREGFDKALFGGGLNPSVNSSLSIAVSVLTWKSKISTKVTTEIESEAEIKIVLTDSAGKPLFTGTYGGKR